MTQIPVEYLFSTKNITCIGERGNALHVKIELPLVSKTEIAFHSCFNL